MKSQVAYLPLFLALAFASPMIACEGKKPAATKADPTTAVASATRVDEGEWCAEHGVPESICTRCHAKLIADFKQKGDWCKEHNLPESQCIACDPSLKEKFAAMAPKTGN